MATSELFKTPKPERVIKKILDIATHEGDLVVDFFSGSGTTAAVAMKMKRQFIAVEQMDYIETFTLPRLVEVTKGEQGGVSKDVGWKGGSGFIYCELAVANQPSLTPLKRRQQLKSLQRSGQICRRSFLVLSCQSKAIDESKDEFANLSLADQKRFLVEVLDKNMLYVPASEIDDQAYAIPEADKAVNKKFFG